MFFDAEEATQDQLKCIRQAKGALAKLERTSEEIKLVREDLYLGHLVKGENLYLSQAVSRSDIQDSVIQIPQKFQHVDLGQLAQTQSVSAELQQVLRRVHPWSTIHYGMTAVDIATPSLYENYP